MNNSVATPLPRPPSPTIHILCSLATMCALLVCPEGHCIELDFRTRNFHANFCYLIIPIELNAKNNGESKSNVMPMTCHGLLQPLHKSMQKVIVFRCESIVAVSRRPSTLDVQFNQMQIRINFQCEQYARHQRGAADDFLRIARVQLFYQRNDGSAIMH